MQFEILPARDSDVPQILATQEECDLSAWSYEAYREEVSRGDSIFLVAIVKASEVAGFIVGRKVGGHPFDNEAEIYNIGVGKRFQRSGIGSALLTAFLRLCGNGSVSSVWLDVRESNRQAISFYSKHGFSEAGLRNNFYSDPVEHARIMVLRPLVKKAQSSEHA